MSLLSLPDQILTQVTLNLELKDLLALGDSHTRLRDLVYKTPEIWTSDLLFPAADGRITDKFIKGIVPRITRHYGILSLKMIHLPLTWTGYFMIFDQFAHSVKHIHIETSLGNLRQLVHHLGVFAGNLEMLQRSNKIPITFRQYSFDHEEYANDLAKSHYLGQSTLHNLINQFPHMKLDDPPFERLQVFNVDIKEEQGRQEQQHLLNQLESLTCFLSGRTMRDVPSIHSPVPTNQVLNNNNDNKRQRGEEEEQYLNSSNKYMRHEVSPRPQQQQQQPSHYPYHHHHHYQEQRPDHSEQEPQPQQQRQHHRHHQITKPYSTTNYV